VKCAFHQTQLLLILNLCSWLVLLLWQALDCTEQLVKSYCLKKRACTQHMQALEVRLSADNPGLFRFCQQCGKFECVSKFGEWNGWFRVEN
jgi:hypothetical protein